MSYRDFVSDGGSDVGVQAIAVQSQNFEGKNLKALNAQGRPRQNKVDRKPEGNTSGVRGRNRVSAIDKQDKEMEDSFESHPISHTEHTGSQGLPPRPDLDASNRQDLDLTRRQTNVDKLKGLALQVGLKAGGAIKTRGFTVGSPK